MSIRAVINPTATAQRPNILAEASAHVRADAGHPYAYCEKHIGTSTKGLQVFQPEFSKIVCPKDYVMRGYVSAVTKTQIVSAMELNIQRAGTDTFWKGAAVIAGLGVVTFLAIPEAVLVGAMPFWILGGVVLALAALVYLTLDSSDEKRVR